MSIPTSSRSSSPTQEDKRCSIQLDPKVLPLTHIHFPPPSHISTSNNVNPGDEEARALLNEDDNDEEKSILPSNSVSRHRHSSVSTAIEEFSSLKFAAQALPCLLLSVIGGTLTGELLEMAHTWPAFVRVPELYILLPILMNLKGNLEMNLTARLSTSANVGDLDQPSSRRQLVWGNLTLLQVQALIVSFFASLMAFVLGLLSRHNLPVINHIPLKPGKLNGPGWNSELQGGYFECLLVLSAGMLAASVNSALLGGLMCGLIILCRQWSINPDNISTPIAASLGDLLTLCFLCMASSALIRYANTLASTIVFVALLGSIGFHLTVTLRNRFVQDFLKIGWLPLFTAMLVSTCTGLLMERFVKAFDGYAVVVLLLTGLTGNVGTILLSRSSTALHAHTPEPSRRVATVLLFLAVTILLVSVTYAGKRGYVELSLPFIVGFTLIAILSSSLSLTLAYVLCHKLWQWGYDPDVYAIPLLTSLVDLATQLMLSSTFGIIQLFSS
ncbi:hypothetical protein CROQUDRAFT_656634 [Cronartium quercuum f. sp. fusiforme G11]|uniref:SLC41A/MgtE integral membrane domain-containing protein n=1 Tax=Cronartium quercuum f. sp. fusiforme G11 TaxID=708437 RepID=A0A9P6NMR3_9BASI|nr:hypothetical protein CROQUDRAFT_656634 [Cronartium quercuum f. sp. fusiforme G11]